MEEVGDGEIGSPFFPHPVKNKMVSRMMKDMVRQRLIYLTSEQTELFSGLLCVSAPLREIRPFFEFLSLAKTQRRKE